MVTVFHQANQQPSFRVFAEQVFCKRFGRTEGKEKQSFSGSHVSCSLLSASRGR